MRAFLMLLAILLATSASAEPVMRVHLLGTGGPELTPDRQGAATLIEAGDQLLLFDAGRGLLQRIYEQRIDPRRVTTIFLTHLHSDHIEGLPGLWITPWFLLGRSAPLTVIGPPGIAAMVGGMRAMYGHDLAKRVNAFNSAAALEVAVLEIEPGIAWSEGGTIVTAFRVEHDDGDPAFGYRIDRDGRSVVLSGDTRPVPALADAAKGADLLVQNVVALSMRLAARPEMTGVMAKLTTPEQAAALFVDARPKLALYSHIVKKGLPGAAGDRTILARTRAAGYRGPLAIAHDRQIVEIGDTARLLPAPSLADLPELDRKDAR